MLLGLVVQPAYPFQKLRESAGTAFPEPVEPGRDRGRSLGWGDGPGYAGS